MSEEVNDGRLPVAGDDNAVAAMALEVAGDGINPAAMRARVAARALDAQSRGEGARQSLDLAGAHSQSVIRLRAGAAHRGLDHVKPVHLGLPRLRRRSADAPA